MTNKEMKQYKIIKTRQTRERKIARLKQDIELVIDNTEGLKLTEIEIKNNPELTEKDYYFGVLMSSHKFFKERQKYWKD